MDLKDVESLIDLLKKEGLESIKIEDGDTKIELSRQNSQKFVPITTEATVITEPVTGEQAPTVLSGKQIVSPMSGTFYGSPSPDEPVFIKVGDQVKKGDVVCVIEAMKTFNRLESEFDGTVKQILVNNADPVEAGQALIILE